MPKARNMQLKPERIHQIADLARELWSDFVDLTQLKSDALLEVSPHPRRPNKATTDFFRFCADIFAPPGVEDRVDANILLYDLKKAAASWLIWTTDSEGTESPTVYLDSASLDENLSMLDAVRARNHLVLHEIGHLVLHKATLKNSGDAPPGAQFSKPAFPEMEAEAWWFCYSLLGLCVSQIAYENTENSTGTDDKIWLHWLR